MRSVLVVGLLVMSASRAFAQPTPPATQAIPAPAIETPVSCGSVPAQADYNFDIEKNGDIYAKNTGNHFWMHEIHPTIWAICNTTPGAIRLRFSRLTCNNAPPPPTMCPVDWVDRDTNEACGGLVKTAAGSFDIASGQWGLIQGLPNSNREECPDPTGEFDAYDFSVAVKPENGAEQTIDPQIQIDRETFAPPFLTLIGGGLTLLLLGYFAGRFGLFGPGRRRRNQS